MTITLIAFGIVFIVGAVGAGIIVHRLTKNYWKKQLNEELEIQEHEFKKQLKAREAIETKKQESLKQMDSAETKEDWKKAFAEATKRD